MRTKVPKCKECSSYYKEKSFGGKNYWHWCYNHQASRNIDSQEIKTSPKWCPNRLGSQENSNVI